VREVRVKAYVLIQTRAGSQPVGAALRAIPGIESTDDLTGPYDAIALASAESMRDLSQMVISRIRELPGVTRALPATLAR
jgi:DNA-binding Lrp family transcriptional regulator